MTSTPRQPLDAEERELAERLAQLGASAEPSAALDARILGAARAATRMGGAVAATPTTTGRARPRRRWPVAMGVAATLVLAVGIAWQMRPIGEMRQTYSEAPAAVQVVDAPSQRPPLRRLPSTEVDAARPPPAPQKPAMAPPPATVEAPDNRTEAAPTADEDAGAEASGSDARTSERRRRDGTTVEAPAEPEPRLLQEAANEAEEISSAAPSAFPAATGTGTPERKALRRETQKAAPEIVLDSGTPVKSAPPPPSPTTPAPQQREPTRTAAPASTAPRESLDRIEITGNRIDRDNDGFSDQVIDDQPPATADSPLVQQAWLQRIRELIARGRIDAARTSLGEFKRRYPRYALPNDLRAFQQGSLAQPADAVHDEGRDAVEDGTDGDEVDADDTDDTDDGGNGGGAAPDASLDATDEGGFER